MLWVLKRTVSMRWFFEHTKQKLKLIEEKIFTTLHSNIFCITRLISMVKVKNTNRICKIDTFNRTDKISHHKLDIKHITINRYKNINAIMCR